MLLNFRFRRILDYNKIWTVSKTDANGQVQTSILEGNSIFSLEEQAKLDQAFQLIKEVRDNYKETHYELRSKIK